MFSGASIEAVDQQLYNARAYAALKLKAAAIVVRSLNQDDLWRDFKAVLNRYEQSIPTSETKNNWGVSFDILFRESSPHITAEDQSRILNDLEDRLVVLQTLDPWATEAAAKRLATWYRKKGQKDEVERVMLKLQAAYDRYLETVPSFQATSHLEKLYRIFNSFQLSHLSREILIRIRKADKDLVSGKGENAVFKKISIEHSIPVEELNSLRDVIFSGTITERLTRFFLRNS